MALPAHFRRLVAHRTGHSFREVAEIDTVSAVQPQEGQVLVKVAFAGVNGGCETFRARGEFVFAKNKGADEYVLGAEGVGVIVAVGPEVSELEVGQHVACGSSGAFAEYVIANAASCYPVREASAEAVGVSLSGLTAAAALEVTGNMKVGETVLVTAAAGATGHFGVQLAKLAGCHVVATVGSKGKADVVRQLGADRIINYHEEDMAAVLAREYPQKIDLAYEGVGGSLRDAVVDNLAPGGRLLAVGYISSYPHNDRASSNGDASHSGSKQQANGAASTGSLSSRLTPPHELMWQAQTLNIDGRVIHGNVWPKDRGRLQATKSALFERFYQGQIVSLVDNSRQFAGVEQVCDAVDYMLTGKAIGKVVVRF